MPLLRGCAEEPADEKLLCEEALGVRMEHSAIATLPSMATALGVQKTDLDDLALQQDGSEMYVGTNEHCAWKLS